MNIAIPFCLKTIVSVTRDWAIGAQGDLLIHNPHDMRFFKEHTLNSTVVMGWNTLLSLPGEKPLPKRRNIVLYDNLSFTQADASARGFEVAHSPEEVLALLRASEKAASASEASPTGNVPCSEASPSEDTSAAGAPPSAPVAWIIGGAAVYKTFLPYCTEALVTMNDVNMKDKADAFFPNLLEDAHWKLVSEIDGGITSQGFDYTFQTYKNLAPKPFYA